MKTTYYLLIICLLGCQANKTPKAVPKANRPNIILIMADDLGFETLGCYGSTDYQSPHLDQMAAEGMRFDSCYSTPLCTPSRIQIMTGKYNFRNYRGFGILDSTETTFGHLMQQGGYKTAIVGKWQLYGNKRQVELANQIGSWPQQAGFDEFCLWQIDQRGSRFKDPLLFTNNSEPELFEGKYGPDIFCSFIEDYMEKNQANPFFIYYPMVLTHDPFQPTPDNPEFEAYELTQKVNDSIYFRDYLSYSDKIVGKIIAKLKALEIAENTLVLFVGDNGTDRDVISSWKGQRIRGNKGFPTEFGTHVPGIAWWPGTISPSINKNLTDFTDILPTIMEAAHIAIPKEFHTDGFSFYQNLISGDLTPPRNWVYCSYAPNWGKFKNRTYVHSHTHKLDTDGHFYNIQDDPHELQPIKEAEMNTELREIKADLQAVLDKMQP